jgi:hypothetical protein
MGRKTFKGRTHMGLVIDRSGSMAWTNPNADEILAKWLSGVQEAPEAKDCDLRVAYFDDVIDHVKPQSLKDVRELHVEPRGSTALYDATAEMIGKLDETDMKADRTLLIVITDGGENASREYHVHKDGWKRLRKLMDKRIATGRWTIVFLAAELDSVENAAMAMAVGANNSSPRGMGYMGDQGVIATRNYLAGSAAASANFVEPEPKATPSTTGASTAK